MKKINSHIFFISLLLSVCLIGCTGRPSYVLSEDKMVSLMVDMELAEAYVNTNMGSSSKDKLILGERVLKAHGVSEETLDTTLAWYGRNIDDYAGLFEKVDKEIEKRRKKYTEVPGEKSREPDNLWPYDTHIIISNLSGSDALAFSVVKPEMEKGDVLELSYHLPNPVIMKGTFGVEYTDGYGEAINATSNSRNSVHISLQTDSAKEVSRIFGIMAVKDRKILPVYLDSIMIKAEPLDSISYSSKRRTQKSFRPLS